jgi:hypothetical protein
VRVAWIYAKAALSESCTNPRHERVTRKVCRVRETHSSPFCHAPNSHQPEASARPIHTLRPSPSTQLCAGLPTPHIRRKVCRVPETHHPRTWSPIRCTLTPLSRRPIARHRRAQNLPIPKSPMPTSTPPAGSGTSVHRAMPLRPSARRIHMLSALCQFC